MGKPIEKSEKKISVGMKILAGLTIASAVVEALYRVAGKLGAERGLSWQVWVTKVRDVNLVMVLPLLLLLLANEARPFEENVWVCYRRKGIFFRTPGELEDGDRQRHLEEKYGCGFTALGGKGRIWRDSVWGGRPS